MKRSPTESPTIESSLLAGCIKYPNAYYQISQYITENDFVASGGRVHRGIFSLIRDCREKSETIDITILAERLRSLGITFQDGIDCLSYLESLNLKPCTEDSTLSAAKELKKMTIKREIIAAAKETIKAVEESPPTASTHDIVHAADSAFNRKIDVYASEVQAPQNIYEDMERMVEERAANPVDDFGPLLPNYPYTNRMYGSLFIPGSITVIVARPGVGKTTIALEWGTLVGNTNDIPVLHFDNGEMSKEELTFRQCACLSDVPLHYIQTGKWAQNPEFAEKVRATFKRIKNWKFFYYDVGGMSVSEMMNVARRFYYNKVGRGKRMIISYDYIKSGGEEFNKKEYQIVGDMMEAMKLFIKREVTYDDKPMISLFTSVQQNRFGESDSDQAISLSDRIKQIASSVFFLRRKSQEEIMLHGETMGTHILKNDKCRNMGEDVARAQTKVKMPDGSISDNMIFLEINNFSSKEICDLREWADKARGEFVPR